MSSRLASKLLSGSLLLKRDDKKDVQRAPSKTNSSCCNAEEDDMAVAILASFSDRETTGSVFKPSERRFIEEKLARSNAHCSSTDERKKSEDFIAVDAIAGKSKHKKHHSDKKKRRSSSRRRSKSKDDSDDESQKKRSHTKERRRSKSADSSSNDAAPAEADRKRKETKDAFRSWQEDSTQRNDAERMHKDNRIERDNTRAFDRNKFSSKSSRDLPKRSSPKEVTVRSTVDSEEKLSVPCVKSSSIKRTSRDYLRRRSPPRDHRDVVVSSSKTPVIFVRKRNRSISDDRKAGDRHRVRSRSSSSTSSRSEHDASLRKPEKKSTIAVKDLLKLSHPSIQSAVLDDFAKKSITTPKSGKEMLLNYVSQTKSAPSLSQINERTVKTDRIFCTPIVASNRTARKCIESEDPWAIVRKDADALDCAQFQQAYFRYRQPYIDSHCHLDLLMWERNGWTGSFTDYKSEKLSGMLPPNYAGCVTNFAHPKYYRSNTTRLLKLLTEEGVYGSVGCHPKCATNSGDWFDLEATIRKIIECSNNSGHKIVAIGECGLDYSSNMFQETAKDQQRVFIEQMKLAKELRLPVIIHARDAEDDVFELMKRYLPRDHLIHRHCFTYGASQLRKWRQEFDNMFFGFTPTVTYNDSTLRETLQEIPLDKLLLETDAPYFIPRDQAVRKMSLHGCSYPGLAICVASHLANVRNISVDHILERAWTNTIQVYGSKLSCLKPR